MVASWIAVITIIAGFTIITDPNLVRKVMAPTVGFSYREPGSYMEPRLSLGLHSHLSTLWAPTLRGVHAGSSGVHNQEVH
jgi:hypothetical protein